MPEQSDPKVMTAADMTVRTFAILRALLNHDSDKANEVLDALDDEQGWLGVLCLVRAVAMTTMDFSGLRPIMAAAAPGDAARLVDEHYLWATPDGVGVAPEGPERDLITAGMRFMIMAADESDLAALTDDFRRQYHEPGDELPTTVSGVLTVTLMAIQMLPQHLREKLATFQPDAAFVVDAAQQKGVLPK